MSTVQGRAAHRLYTGSVLVAQRVGAWFVPAERPVAATVRCVGAGWLGLHLAPGLLDHGALIAATGACWYWAAWRAEPKDAEADKTNTASQPTHTPEEIQAAILQLLHTAVAGRNGVHIAELLAELQDVDYLGPDVTVTELRRTLERWGITTRDSVKVAGTNKPGVHRDDLQPLPEPLPSPDLAAAG